MVINYLTRFIIGVKPVGLGLIGTDSEDDSATVLSEQIGLGRLCLVGSGMSGHCGFSSVLLRFFILDSLASNNDGIFGTFESDWVLRIDRVTGLTSFAVGGRDAVVLRAAETVFFSLMRVAVARPAGRHGGRDLSFSSASSCFFRRYSSYFFFLASFFASKSFFIFFGDGLGSTSVSIPVRFFAICLNQIIYTLNRKKVFDSSDIFKGVPGNFGQNMPSFSDVELLNS